MRVYEADPLRMKVQPVSGLAVKVVANDRGVEAVGVGAMNAQLMRPAGNRPEVDAGTAVFSTNHLPVRPGSFAVFVTDDLAGPVFDVAA